MDISVLHTEMFIDLLDFRCLLIKKIMNFFFVKLRTFVTCLKCQKRIFHKLYKDCENIKSIRLVSV